MTFLGDDFNSSHPCFGPFEQILIPVTAGAEPVVVIETLGKEDVAGDIWELRDDLPNERTELRFIVGFPGKPEDDWYVDLDTKALCPIDQVMYLLR